MKTVGIIGGSGFIGSHITKKFLAEGYFVKVSATDISRQDKYEHLYKLANAENLTVSQLDVANEASLKTFMADCALVIHCGTPFQLGVENPQKEVFDPTIRGTENFLNVVSQTTSVEKVVFVASVASYNTLFPMPVSGQPANHLYSEADAPYLNAEAIPYCQAKYYADQAVRTFVAANPDAAFEVVSVFPTLVVGPALSDRADSTSVGLQYLFKNKLMPDAFIEMLFANDVEFAVVAVSDVAEAIFLAATTPGLHGKNYLLTGESWKVSDISSMLNKETPAGTARTVYSNASATQELGMQFQPAQVPLHEYAGS
ncbi:NAD-dependent epimerase/dehydratase family protein [Spirosoma areae]